MNDILPTSVLNESSVAVVLAPQKSGKSTLIRSCVSLQNPDVVLVIVRDNLLRSKTWEGCVPNLCMFDEASRFPPDIKSSPREHKKCVISEFASGGLDKNALMNARFTNTKYWLEDQSQCQVSSVVMANADLVFFRQVPERQLQWIWRNYLSCNVVKFETLKEHMTKTDTVPYMYTVLAFRNCEVQFYSYVAPRQLALEDVKDKRLGSEEFWRELTALETNEYFQYSGEP